MIRLDRLKLAAGKAVNRVREMKYDSSSSFGDLAGGLSATLHTHSMSPNKNRDFPSNVETFRIYFRALNDYFRVLDSDKKISEIERFGSVMDGKNVCALPEVRNMTYLDAELLGFRNSKLAYIWALKLNRDKSE